MNIRNEIPLDVLHLFPVLDGMLIDLLKSLTPNEWNAQTVAKRWKVKDVVAHLLDGNIRVLSMLRDGYYGVDSPEIKSHEDLVNFLNGLNADWVTAMKRVSPEMLILLHQTTGQLYYTYYASLNPFDKAGFAVNWAGENESKNWMHIAREYTEKWLHQQQIRDAVNKPGLMTKDLFYPFIDIFMMALPYTYRNVDAKRDTIIQVTIMSEIGGSWFLTKDDNGWSLSKAIYNRDVVSTITISPSIAWKLFSKSVRPEEIKDAVTITGDARLAAVALTMISVMA
jgi:hypothetical protein